MNRRKLKRGGCRKKALFGVDAAIQAAATLTAASIGAAATAQSAKTQAKAVTDNARAQAEALRAQNENNNDLQKQSIEFTRSQNQQTRQQMTDFQTSLQMMAGQQNLNDRLERNKVMAKYGKRVNKLSNMMPTSYGGGGLPFTVTDGGSALPLQVDQNGYGVYELYGNDHNHYHKTKSGKYKSGVGIKFKDGGVIEGEGNQNSNNGELMWVTPNDAIFLSKHNIDGFNPAQAVKNGMHPEQAYITQEILKDINNLDDDGSRKSKTKKASLGLSNPIMGIANTTQSPLNIVAPVTGAAYVLGDDASSPLKVRCGGRKHLKCGGKKRKKAEIGLEEVIDGGDLPDLIVTPNTGGGKIPNSFLNTYGGALINSGANLIGGAISSIGAKIGANRLNRAYGRAGQILADAYGNLKTIDMDLVNSEDFKAGNSIAAIRDAQYSNMAQRERLRRGNISEVKEINRGTLSSAARQNRLASTNDRYNQRISELSEQENNINEQIKQANAERITNVSKDNMDRQTQARKDYVNARLSLAQYNNDIENMKILGSAQASADAITAGANAKSAASYSVGNSIANALTSSGNAFSTAYSDFNKQRQEFTSAWMQSGDADKVTAALARAEQTGDLSFVKALYNDLKNRSYNEIDDEKIQTIVNWAERNNIKLG